MKLKPISDRFFDGIDWLSDYAPSIVCMLVMTVLWLLAFPVRLLVLLLLPMHADRQWHWAYKIHRFFAFV